MGRENDMEETIQDIALKCVTFSGRNEDDLFTDYERRCNRLKVLPLFSQLRTALRGLLKSGKIFFKEVDGHKLLCKK